MMCVRIACHPSRGGPVALAALLLCWPLPLRAVVATPPPGSPPPVALRDVVLDGLAFTSRRRTLSIPHVEARGTSLSADALRDILDPDSALTPGQRAAALSAASIVMPTVTLSIAPGEVGTQGQSVTAHDVLLTAVVAGKAATMRVGSIDGEFEPDPGQRGRFSSGAVTARAIDAALAAAIATGKRDDAALPPSPIFAALSAADARLDVEGVTISIAELDFGPIEGRPPLVPWRELPAALDRAGADATSGRIGFVSALVDFAASYKLDRLALAGLAVQASGGPTFTSSLRSLTVADLNLFRVGSIESEGFSYDAPDLGMTLARLKLADIGRGSLFGMLLGRASGLFNPDEHGSAPDENSLVDLSDLQIALRSTTDDGPFPRGTVNTVRVPTAKAEQTTSRDGAHVGSDTQVTVRYDLPAAGTGRDVQDLRDAGLSKLDLTFGFRLDYDAGTRVLDLDAASLDGAGLGAASISAHLGAVEPLTASPTMTEDALVARLANSTFGGLAVTLTDRGIVGTALPVLARRADSTAERYRAGLKAAVHQPVGDVLGATPAAERIEAAVAAFLDGPGTLSLTVAAPPGLTLREIAASDPAAVAGRLAIDAQARH